MGSAPAAAAPAASSSASSAPPEPTVIPPSGVRLSHVAMSKVAFKRPAIARAISALARTAASGAASSSSGAPPSTDPFTTTPPGASASLSEATSVVRQAREARYGGIVARRNRNPDDVKKLIHEAGQIRRHRHAWTTDGDYRAKWIEQSWCYFIRGPRIKPMKVNQNEILISPPRPQLHARRQGHPVVVCISCHGQHHGR